MNYLAHAYLSFGIPEITVGNLISDFIKGKKKFDYPTRIQQGIALHRAIDDFTDMHAITRRAKLAFKEAYGLYAGPIIDVVYDHFLANDPLIFPNEAQLETFAQKTYAQVAIATGIDAITPAQTPETSAASTTIPAHDASQQAPPSMAPAAFPERFIRVFHYMRTQDWLYHYRFKQGLYNSLDGLARRAAYMGNAEKAHRLFDENFSELETCYIDFFPALKDFALRTLENLQHNPG